MTLLRTFLVLGLAFLPNAAPAQSTPPVVANSAAQALQYLLDRNIQPSAGPLTGDGATIAGVLAGQSLTFPMASSSGAFVSIPLGGFGPPIPVSASGNFGPLFAERGLTNGPGNLSLSLSYQYKVWRSVSGIKLRGFDLSGRSVFRENDEHPPGTADDFTADIDFRTHVVVLAANYGVFSFLDVGVSLPYVQSIVKGTKVGTRTLPRGGASVVRARQEVSGTSSGVGDPIVRVKGRIPTLGLPGTRRFLRDVMQVAAGYDLRIPTGKTATLVLDCARPPACANADTQEVPDIGLGQMTHKWSGFISWEVGRLSPHANLGYVRVPTYQCRQMFSADRRCRGTIFDVDPVNGNQDAKGQNLSNEWNATVGVDYQLQPFRSTISVDVIGRQLIRAGQFFDGPARLVFGNSPSPTISTRIESRAGNVNTAVGVIGAKVGIHRRWVIVGNVLFPLNSAGLQPTTAWVIGLERALTR
jgi:hypothetical protein